MIGEVRGVGVFWALDLVLDRTTREPLAPYGGTSPAMGELVGACKERGLLPFTNYHRMHVVPPCTISEEEAREAALEALRAADERVGWVPGHPDVGVVPAGDNPLMGRLRALA